MAKVKSPTGKPSKKSEEIKKFESGGGAGGGKRTSSYSASKKPSSSSKQPNAVKLNRAKGDLRNRARNIDRAVDKASGARKKKK